MHILILGGNGQVGWEVAQRATKADLHCYLPSRAELNITHRELVLSAVHQLKPSVVVNTAAYTMVDKAENEVDIAFAVNRDGAANVAEACALNQIPLIYISTDYVFDGTKRCPYNESDSPSPLNTYGSSKLAGEDVIRQICVQHIILRTSWVYGIHGGNFVKTMLRLGYERDVLRVVDDQYGAPTFAGDLAKSIVTLVRRLQSPQATAQNFGIFHCTGRGATSWFGFARAIFDIAEPLLGRKPRLEPIMTPDYNVPAQRPAYSVLDCSKLAKAHGIIMRRWEKALAETMHQMHSRL